MEIKLLRRQSGQNINLNIMGQTIPENEFRLGLTMAGAISAGCYTGGVMDYLLEMLDLWEKAKNGQLPEFEAHKHKIPKHKVIIDAMGGASAGAMTTTMAAIYALNGNINPVTNPDKCKELTGNLLYDSWVFMDDKDPKDNRSTFEKVWDKSDLEKGLLHSILNSSFVDRIADSAFNYNGNIKDKADALPSYIS